MRHGTATGGDTVTLQFDGSPVTARKGETIAAALVANGLLAQGRARTGEPRGVFCGMGVCHDCLVTVDGRAGVRACMTKAADGMRIGPQAGRPDVRTGGTDLAPLPAAPLAEEAVDLLVVGAGPGGLAAALAARRAGLTVLVTDERPAPGGQYYKQPATEGLTADGQALQGAKLIAEARGAGIALRDDTLVWGAFREEAGLVVGVYRQGVAGYIRPRTLIVATGAYEQPGVFPGWTLPGVMTTGAAQTLLRSYGVTPGQRVLVAGNGPLNLQVAVELLRAGAEVVAVAEAAPAPWTRAATGAAMMAAEPALAAAGLRQLAVLAAKCVPVLWGHRLARVDGTDRATDAVLTGPAGAERRFAIHAVCVGEGFSPVNEIARLLGCEHRVRGDGATARLEAVRDDAGGTSQPDVFVVGEAGGFGGAHIAMAQGRLAGAEAARRLGHSVPEDAEARRLLARHRRFQAILWRVFAADDPGLSRADDDTPVCRCEGVALGVLRRTIAAEGVADLPTLKRLTRAGMGRCQGRYCMPRLATLVGRPAVEADFPTPQVPLRPVPVAALAVEKPEWGGHKRALLPPFPPLADTAPLGIAEAPVVVVGAGIAGLSTALFLARAGVEVVVLDRGHPNGRASGGNAGSLHGQLLSFDHGAKAEGDGGAAARTLPLQRESIDLWMALERETGRDLEIKLTGGLMVAEDERALAWLGDKTRVERAQGIECHVIGAAELRALEPALDERFVGAAYCPQEGKINPLVATQAVLDAAKAAGARVFPLTDVTAIERDAAGFAVHTQRGVIRAGRVVNAAGGFASRVGRMLGVEVPVFGAPLQMVVTEAVEPLVTCLVAHADRHLTLKQAANGNLIIGGAWTAGLDPVHHHPRPLRASIEGNLWVAQHVVPALRKLTVLRTWAAMNINIDGAPILGEHPAVPGFFNAVTSNGYTLGPIVGRITADLIRHGEAGRDLAPFSIARFKTAPEATRP
ncbi:FAD-dependent oxidoreductase [Azospirillum sp. RWY-5-1]|uniref:FAD-dependent oxidoreductase n=1 Tax=Azospirillum oleiclasticum TaxID=2735135 RepID=A0ABX2TI78_9PROT|nr:FAD-dependent oxidoreductase [Azospirillum oleiclasticum]NYZ16487.1 FAD-dependent oxidoreductase [Azospirillum oleiclasticum]NYZ24044.1 FAD-dependent oxidoreductase [Azospirillum oleiclasticum]